MSRILLRNGVIHGAPDATALAIDEDRIVFVGSDDEAAAYDDADETVDLYGALATPAFVDAHTHSVLTGFQLTRLDLRHTANLTEALDMVAELAEHTPEGVVVGTGWEEHSWPEGRPPTQQELERAAPGRMVLLERRDCHSSVISGALQDAVPGLTGLDGFDANGRVERDARQAVSEALGELIGPDQRLIAATASAAAMAANGIAGFHEAAAPHIGPAYEIDLIRHAAARVGILPTIYWGERDAFAEAKEWGVAGLAGDLNCDGAIGSRTAAMHHDYDDQPGNHGHAFLTPTEIADHLEACTDAGLQGGFHCIGEAALENLADGLGLLRDRIGPDRIRAARHRFEHVEMPSDRLLALMAELGVGASMQPMFDDLWGGPDQMYADRLGERWRGMNPVGRMARAGVRMAFGSDTPVTQIGPWSAVRAAVLHRDTAERVDPATAFEAHSAGGWWAAGHDDAGHLRIGQKAHVAIWDCPVGLAGDLPVLDEGAPLPWLRHLYVDGILTGEER
ncbi:MAG: amidohydrolase [Myxococcales bacterium]|nr:MAG: amidohydrolase [Myxococcales bacterium]